MRIRRLKLSGFAEEFFRRLAERLGGPMLMRKGELHRLVAGADPRALPAEVGEKLGRLQRLFEAARPTEPMGDADLGSLQQ